MERCVHVSVVVVVCPVLFSVELVWKGKGDDEEKNYYKHAFLSQFALQ